MNPSEIARLNFCVRLVAITVSLLVILGCAPSRNSAPEMSYTCATCGEEHDELPAIGVSAPFHWSADYELDTNSLLTSDLCIIEARDYFIRGVIQIPIHNSDQTFDWGVWVSQKKENFELYRKHFDEGVQIGPFLGWLSTKINYYADDTINLKTMAHFSTNGTRPLIKLEPSDHPLAVQQRDGITLEEAWRIVHSYDQK